jgi:acyl-coenzyme A synthetase/AMP-(fatty) acid ligase
VARWGAPPTPLPERTTQEARDKLLLRHKSRWLVQDPSSAWHSNVLLPDAYLDMKELLRAPDTQISLEAAPVAHDADNSPWLIALSSGTTGTPKSIPFTHSKTAIAYALGRGTYTTEQRILVAADFATAMGIGNALRALLHGASAVLTQRVDASHILALIERHQVTRYVTSTALAGLLLSHITKSVPNSREICRSLEVMAISGASAPPALREGMISRICPQIEINYGSTEAGPMATATTQTLATHPDSAGRIHYWMEAEAVDEQDRPLAPGEVGRLRFRSPTVCEGYIGDPEATAKSFRDGWCYPGDLGSIDKGGYLTLGGRVDHVLNMGGRKLDPTQIENVLNAHPAVAESAVIAGKAEEGLVSALIAVVVQSSAVTTRELKALCLEKLGASLTPRHVVFMDALPKNAGGKVMRAELSSRIKLKRIHANDN